MPPNQQPLLANNSQQPPIGAQPPDPQATPSPSQQAAPKYTREQYAEMERKARYEHNWKAVDYFQRKQAEMSGGTTFQQQTGDDEDPTSGMNLLGAAIEPNLAMLTGGVATPLAGIAGMGRGGMNLLEEALGLPQGRPAEETVRAVQDMAYQPHSTGGQNAMKGITAPLQALAGVVPALQEYGLPNDNMGVGGMPGSTPMPNSPALLTALDTAIQGAPAILGGKGLAKVKDFSPRQAVADVAGRVSPAAKRVIEKPPESPDLATLRKADIVPTVGQRLSTSKNPIKQQLSRWEESLSSSPIFGAPIIDARGRPLVEHVWAQLNDARTPVGIKPFKPGEMSVHEALQDTERQLNAKYDSVLSRTEGYAYSPQGAGSGPGFISDLRHAYADALGHKDNVGPRGQAAKFDSESVPLTRATERTALKNMQNQIIAKISELNTDGPRANWDLGGKIHGYDLKTINADLKEWKQQYAKGGTYERQLVPYISKMQEALKGMVERSNPGAAAELKTLDQAYSQFKLVQSAATRGGALGKAGLFTPRQMMVQVENRARRRPEGQTLLSHGEAQGQKLAQAAENVLGNKVPNTGSADRLLAAAELTGDVATAAGDAGGAGDLGAIAPKLLAGLIGMPLLYKRGTQKWLGSGGKTPLPGAVLAGAPAGLQGSNRAADFATDTMNAQLQDLGVP